MGIKAWDPKKEKSLVFKITIGFHIWIVHYQTPYLVERQEKIKIIKPYIDEYFKRYTD